MKLRKNFSNLSKKQQKRRVQQLFLSDLKKLINSQKLKNSNTTPKFFYNTNDSNTKNMVYNQHDIDVDNNPVNFIANHLANAIQNLNREQSSSSNFPHQSNDFISDDESISSSVESDYSSITYCDTCSESSLDEIDLEKPDNVINKFKNIEEFLIHWYNTYDVKQNSFSFLLKGLKKFGHPELPMDARTMTKSCKINCSATVEPLNTGTYIHYGMEKAIVNQLNCVNEEVIPHELILNIHVDGLSISKSSNSQVWPILGKICNSPSFTEPFVIGAYHGYGKPADANTFMEDFIHEFIFLCDVGLTFNEKIYKVRINAVIADTVARNFILCFPPHNSRCGKCLQEGKTIQRRRVFLENNSEPRTDENFRTNVPEKYKYLISPLQGVVSLTAQVPLDPMHLIGPGVTLRHVKLFLKAIGNADHGNIKTNLNSDYCSLREWVPNDFARKPRSFDELKHFKFTELRMLCLYTGPVIFSKYMSERAMVHFNSFHLGTRILSDPDKCISLNEFSKDLYFFYINEMKQLFGETQVVYNVHNLEHLPDDVLRYGNLDSFSAAEFENYLGILRKMIRNGKHVLLQIINRINERAQAKLLNKTIASQNSKIGPFQYSLCRSISAIGLPVNYSNPHAIIKFSNFEISNSKPDNCCYLKDGSIFVIEHICKNSNSKTVILGRKFVDCTFVENYPVDSRDFDIYKATTLGELEEHPIKEIKKKAFRMFFQDTFYIYPILHT